MSYNKVQTIQNLEKCTKLSRLELQGNRIVDVKSFPQELEITILYLQEFDRSGANLVCNSPGYEIKVYKIFSKLKALDGNRKNVPMNYNMKEALPAEDDIDDAEYDAGQTEWFDKQELEERNPEKHRFEAS